jgi:hypothetical protein
MQRFFYKTTKSVELNSECLILVIVTVFQRDTTTYMKDQISTFMHARRN